MDYLKELSLCSYLGENCSIMIERINFPTSLSGGAK